MFCLRVLQFSSFSKISRFYKETVIYIVYEETVKLGEPRYFPFMKCALVCTLKCSYMNNCICALFCLGKEFGCCMQISIWIFDRKVI